MKESISILKRIISPSYWGLYNYRIANFLYMSEFLRPLYYFYFPIWRLISLITGIEIYGKTFIGKNLRVVHFGGIFINPQSKIGDNCTTYNNVIIGSREYTGGESPIIGNNVRIGSGAKILGGIIIGDNVDIGANAVVIKDVPSNVIVGGVPARILKEK
ncbi:MAG: Serine acetyltransferase [candidate division WS6 bacterium 34_10]|uniref:Serine acetyltransferase n=1 Tax=candidate division WS6 bacterium 34_10 TaxID=1641389 RepID=A0A117M0M7_9BACT|nr:MAG: Serine acetyltransferase [candidate division WS6 bacterium 34_10]